jgi:hypothetical protein
MTVRVLFLPIVAVMAMALASCSQETSGDATPGDSTGRPTIPTGDVGTTEPTEPTETGGGGDSGTAGLQPCDLLTSSEQATFDLGAGSEEVIGPARACLWQASDQHSISVGVIDNLGLDDVQSSGTKQETTVGSHDAVRYDGPLGTCSFAVGVTDTSRVDVSGVASGDMAKACSIAKQAAELVEPKLP